MTSVKESNYRIAKLLIDFGADVNHHDMKGKTALMISTQNDHSEMCKLLVESGADVNHSDKEGKTSLMISAEKGFSEICRTLLESGADVNQNDNDDNSPIFFSSKSGYSEISTLFLKHGAIAETLFTSCEISKDSLIHSLQYSPSFFQEYQIELLEFCDNFISFGPNSYINVNSPFYSSSHEILEGDSEILNHLLDQVRTLSSFSNTFQYIQDLEQKITQSKNIIKELEKDNQLKEGKNIELQSELISVSSQRDDYLRQVQCAHARTKKAQKTNAKQTKLQKFMLLKLKKPQIIEFNEEIEKSNPSLPATTSLIQEMITNSHQLLKQRRYSLSRKEICYILFIHSPKTYDILRRFLPDFQSEENLRKTFKSAISIKRNQLMSIFQMQFILQNLLENHDIQNKEIVPSVKSFDAAIMDKKKE
jgi:ankyrin repeat protein